MLMLCNVTDGGKTNNNGRIKYSAVLPHRNPLLCCMFAKGAALLWRFRVMSVPFPDLLKPEDIFKRCVFDMPFPTCRFPHTPALSRFTLRQGYDEFKPVTYDSECLGSHRAAAPPRPPALAP